MTTPFDSSPGFSAAPAASEGARLQLAQVEDAGIATPVAEIAELAGEVVVHRADGANEAAAPGLPLFVGDTVETQSSSLAKISFIDGATVSIDAGTTLAVDDVSYNPGGDGNSMLLSVMKGAFEFIAGAIAPADGDGMAIQTSAGTLSVRGTSGVGVQDIATGNWHFSLIRDANGHLGRIVILNAAGEVLLDEEFETTRLLNGFSSPDEPRTLTMDEMRALYGEVVRNLPHLNQEIESGEAGEGDESGEAAPDQQTFTTETVIQQIVAAAQTLGIIVMSDNTISSEILAPALLPSIEADAAREAAMVEALRGIFDDIFEAPLVPMPVRPSDPAPTPDYNHIYGTAAGESLFGGPGADHIHGNAGDDHLHGFEGNDILDGGAGDDWVHYTDLATTHGAKIYLAAGEATDDGHGGHDKLVGIENVIGTIHDDIIDARGAGANKIDGSNGNDTIYGDAVDTLSGGNGNDQVHAKAPTSGQIDGGSGTDTWHLVDSANDLVDLSAVNVNGTERIDLSQSVNSALTLSAADVLNISDDDVLMIFGDTDNSVTSIGQGWTLNGTSVENGQMMDIYTSGGATLFVDQDILATLS